MAKKERLDESPRWSEVSGRRARSIAQYPASGDDPSMRTYPIKPSFLLGMAMVFGFGAPLSNRILDRLTVRKEQPHGGGIADSWRVVANDFRSILQAPSETPVDERDGGE